MGAPRTTFVLLLSLALAPTELVTARQVASRSVESSQLSLAALPRILRSAVAEDRLPSTPLHSTERRIPRLIHQTYKTSELPSDFAEYQKTWVDQNPGYALRLYNDTEAREFVAAETPEYLATYDALECAVERADLFRYLVVLALGGVYADVDTHCTVPIEEYARPGDTLVVGWEQALESQAALDQSEYVRMHQLLQWTFMAAPGHPALRALCDRIRASVEGRGAAQAVDELAWRDANLRVLNTTGPGPFTDEVLRFDAEHHTVRFLPQSAFGLTSQPGPMTDHRAEGIYALHHFAGSWKQGPARPPLGGGSSEGYPNYFACGYNGAGQLQQPVWVRFNNTGYSNFENWWFVSFADLYTPPPNQIQNNVTKCDSFDPACYWKLCLNGGTNYVLTLGNIFGDAWGDDVSILLYAPHPDSYGGNGTVVVQDAKLTTPYTTVVPFTVPNIGCQSGNHKSLVMTQVTTRQHAERIWWAIVKSGDYNFGKVPPSAVRTFNASFAETEHTDCLEDGDYVLVMGDSHGTGWYGAEIHLQDSKQRLLVSGSMNYGSEQALQFRVPSPYRKYEFIPTPGGGGMYPDDDGKFPDDDDYGNHA